MKEVLSELDALAGAKPFTAEEVGVARDAEARSFPETFESPGGVAGILLLTAGSLTACAFGMRMSRAPS